MKIAVWYTTRTVTTAHFNPECQHVKRMISENKASEIIEVDPDGGLPLNTEWCCDCIRKAREEAEENETLYDRFNRMLPRDLWPPAQER